MGPRPAGPGQALQKKAAGDGATTVPPLTASQVWGVCVAEKGMTAVPATHRSDGGEFGITAMRRDITQGTLGGCADGKVTRFLR